MNGRPRVEAALAKITGFEAARITRQLSNGPTNSSFRVEQGGESFVLRLDKPGAQLIGLDRRNECRVYGQLARHGMLPPVVHCDPDEGLLIRRWVDGRPWTAADMTSPDRLDRLAGTLRLLHGLPVTAKKFDPLGAVRRYAADLDSDQARSIAMRAEKLCAKDGNIAPRGVICHNDLVCQNILELEGGGPPQLIDWEYTALGNPYFDLAIVVRHHGMSDELAHGFLHSYLGSPPSQEDQNHLKQQCDLYACLLDLWTLRFTL